MQAFTLHSKHYKLFSHLRTQHELQSYRDHYQRKILTWKLTAERTFSQLKQELSDLSCATYYRIKKTISMLDDDIMPPSKKPRHKEHVYGDQKRLSRVEFLMLYKHLRILP